MLTKSYNETKKEVLDIYANYKGLLESNKLTVPENIKTEADKIAKDIFRLVILGEAKSGKSTFINAYLGQEILPMDVLQCTSAIIKIHKGPEAKLKAIAADGSSSIIKGTDEIKNFLKQKAAIADEYRCIPVTTINQEILIKQKGTVPPRKFIENFCQTFKDENITNMDFAKYVQQVYEYVQKNSKTWKNLINEIDIEFPLPEEFRGVTIVDTPGVGAAGNVGVITEEYIDKADAIIFVKFATGQALESLSFKNFLANTCKEKNKDRLFLLLTGISSLEKTDLNNLKNQANNLYEHYIPKERIVFVDSKLELILKNCLSKKDIDEIDNYLEHNAQTNRGIYETVELKWLKARGNIDKFTESINEQSNYPMARQVVDKFARVANYLALSAFLVNLNKSLNLQISILKENISLLAEQGEDTEALSKKIEELNVKLDEQIAIFGDKLENSRKNYVSTGGKIATASKALKEEVNKGVSHFYSLKKDEITSVTFQQLKKYCFDKINEAQELKIQLGKNALKDCAKLIPDNIELIPNDLFNPNFTESEYDSIDNDIKEKTSGVRKWIEKGWCFDEEHEIPFHHLDQHVKILADSIKKRLNESIIPTMEVSVIDYVNEIFNQYSNQVIKNIEYYKQNLNQLRDRKNKAESVEAIIKDYESKINEFNEILKQLNSKESEICIYVKTGNKK